MAVDIDLTIGYDALSVNATVEVNAGSQTTYSTEVGLDDMVEIDQVEGTNVTALEMEEARQDIISEMQARGESFGPPELEVADAATGQYLLDLTRLRTLTYGRFGRHHRSRHRRRSA